MHLRKKWSPRWNCGPWNKAQIRGNRSTPGFWRVLLGGIEDPGFQDPENAVIIFDWDDTLLPTTCAQVLEWRGRGRAG